MSPGAEFERENLSPDGISLRTGRVASVRRTLRGAVTSDAASDGSREGAKPLRKFRFENSLAASRLRVSLSVEWLSLRAPQASGTRHDSH